MSVEDATNERALIADVEAYLRSKANESGLLRALEALAIPGAPLTDQMREIHRSALSEVLRKLRSEISDYETAHGITEPETPLALAARRVRFEDYMRTTADGGVAAPPLGPRRTCPCCGYPTLSGRRGDGDVCSLCAWQDDGQDDPDADEVWEGPNHGYSLTEARANFERYLGMFGEDPEKGARIAGDESPTEMETKRMLVAAFRAITRGASDPMIRELWDWTYRCERTLVGEWRTATSGDGVVDD